MRLTWSLPTSPDVAAKRAGGRRRHNAQRQAAAWERRRQIVLLIPETGWPKWGSTTELARRLGVNRSTIVRDLAALRRRFRAFRILSAVLYPPPSPELIRRFAERYQHQALYASNPRPGPVR